MPLHLLDNLANLTDPASSRNALALGTGDSPQFASITTSGATISGSLNTTDNVDFNGGVTFQTNFSNFIDLTAPTITSNATTVNLNATDIALNATNAITISAPINSNITLNGNLIASGIITSLDFSVSTTDGKTTITKNVVTWEFGTKTLSVSSQATTPTGVDFNNTGTKAFVSNATAGALNVYQYNLVTPWDLATGSYSTISKSISSVDTNPRGVRFSRDGLYMYVIGFTLRNVARYTLTSPWDLSTISVNPDQTLPLPPLVAALLGPQGIDFSLNGSKMYIANGFNTNTVYEFDLVNPWVLTGASYSGNSLAVNVAPVSESALTDVVISSDGNRLFILGTTQDRIFEYKLPTPNSLSGAVLNGFQRVVTSATTNFNAPLPAFADTLPTGLYYNDILNKAFFLGDTTDRIQEIIVTPQIRLTGSRPFIEATGADGRSGTIRMNSLYLNDTTVSTGTGGGALVVQGGIFAGQNVCAANEMAATLYGGTNVRMSTAGYIGFTNSTVMKGDTNGIMRFTNFTQNSFDRLQLGGIDSNFPAIKRNGIGLDIVLANDTGFTDLKARNITATGPVIFPSTTVAGLTAFPAATYIGGMVYVSNESGGATMAFSDGTNWRRVQDRAIVS